MTGLQEILNLVDARPTLAAYTSAARQVRTLREELRQVRVALLASYSVQTIVPYLEVEAARHGLAVEIHRGQFNAVMQELFSLRSECLAHQSDVVFVTQLLEDVCPALATGYLGLEAGEVESHIEHIVSEIVSAIEVFRKHSNSAVVVHNFALPQTPALGVFEPMARGSQTDAIRSLNTRLATSLGEISGVYVLDFDRLCADVGYSNWRDDKMWHLARAPLSIVAVRGLAALQAEFLQAIGDTPRKCLVLDLDNTLWGGVLGELGVSGISLGHTYPGSVFREFQQVVLQQYHRGVLLAINSKNNPADVQEVFTSHPDMVLKREHFASVRVNWQNKTDNMAAIAKELGIGLDSLVFFDDNPAERALMRSMLPQILTLDVPADPLGYAKVLLNSRAFDKLSFTDEDRRRGAMYLERAERASLEQSAGSVNDFLTNLNMKVRIAPVDDFTFPRVLDLIRKTNQFNVTTRRYSAAELTAMTADPEYGVFSLRLSDRFGDSGTVGVLIVRTSGTTARIDTLLLSCRVIGRTAETALLAFAAEWARTKGMEHVEGEFIPTPKNAPSADVYQRHGFVATAVAAAGTEDAAPLRWRLNLNEASIEWPPYIHKETDERDRPR